MIKSDSNADLRFNFNHKLNFNQTNSIPD